MRQKFYKYGIRFECQKCGKCCGSGRYEGFVYLTLSDRQRIARYLNISTKQFTHKYTANTKGNFHFKQILHDCAFLKNNKCSIYIARPLQCRAWPFWPENMKENIWMKKIKHYCRGIGKGNLYSVDEIDKTLIKLKSAD